MIWLKALFAGVNLASIGEKLAIIVAVFVFGFAWGQHYASKDAIKQTAEVIQTHADAQFAAATGALAAQHAQDNAAVRNALVVAQTASDIVTSAIAAETAKTERDHAAALKQLAVERISRMKVEASHVIPPSCPAPAPYRWSGAARQLLDAAAGATGPAPVDSPDPDSTTAAASGLAQGNPATLAAPAPGWLTR